MANNLRLALAFMLVIAMAQYGVSVVSSLEAKAAATTTTTTGATQEAQQ